MVNKLQFISILMIVLTAIGVDWRYLFAQGSIDINNNCKYGNFQSPININKKDTEYAKLHIETSVKYGLYQVELFNNATLMYTVKTEGDNVNFTTLDWLRGDGINSEFYDLNHFEIHWRNEGNNGSEHSLENVFGVAEIHFHYYNVLKSKSYQDLKGEKDGIVVQAYIIKVGPKLELNSLFNFNASTIQNEKVDLVLDLSQIISLDENSKFYNYLGSITYPPCEENVQWLILDEPIDITQEQLVKLQSLRGDAITSNVRDQFELTDPRRVLRSFDEEVRNPLLHLHSFESA